MSRLRLAGLVIVLLLVVGIAALFVFGLRVNFGTAEPDYEALAAPASNYDVEIIRDKFGVPHLYGQRDADVVFGLAYAQAEDDWATMQEIVVAARGNLAQQRGADAAVTDYLVHLLRVWPTTNAGYPDLPQNIREIAEAYAHGTNLWASENPDEVWDGVLPVTGEDVIAGFVFKTPFFYGLDGVFKELFEETRSKEISLGPDNAFLWTETPKYPIGSNAFAVAPSRSTDGHTRLLVNSHQPFAGPVAWYEARLKSEEGLDIAGGVFPGAPVILHGHNRNLGWANTVNKPDLADVYVLDVNPDNPNQYRLDGAWRDMDVSVATIKVKLFGPLEWHAQRDVKYSEHGPVLETEHGVYAVRYAGMGETRQLVQYHSLNRANNLEEWMDAMRLQALPSINYVYGDKDGNIAYIYNAQMPKRIDGWDWQKYLPGDRSELIWSEYHDFDNLPQLINPPSGFVFNANNTPFEATDEADDLRPENFPVTMGIETQMTNRGYRGLELLRPDTKISADEFKEYKFDKTYSKDSELAKLIEMWLAEDFSGEPDMEVAQRLLADFDMSADMDDTNAAVAVLAGEPVVWAQIQGTPMPDTIQSLRDTVAHLMEHWGRLDVPWGEVNRIRRGDVDLPLGGGPDLLRAVYARLPQEDGRLVAQGGDTMIYIADWAPDGSLKSESIHQFGSATLDETSPHYADQSPLYATEQFREIPWGRDALEAEATRTYKPGQ
ncbi:acylase [Pyruvatibacter sp. HU-CL02332]|uniref:acylase n=1 Tax=Pyruvatibacter sp. HU-CL02332 TaxID=3127650 RepID=UPI0031027321